jgi:hypothetical protein
MELRAVMRGLDPRIQLLQRMDYGVIGGEATPFFERLCPA